MACLAFGTSSRAWSRQAIKLSPAAGGFVEYFEMPSPARSIRPESLASGIPLWGEGGSARHAQWGGELLARHRREESISAPNRYLGGFAEFFFLALPSPALQMWWEFSPKHLEKARLGKTALLQRLSPQPLPAAQTKSQGGTGSRPWHEPHLGQLMFSHAL